MGTARGSVDRQAESPPEEKRRRRSALGASRRAELACLAAWVVSALALAGCGSTARHHIPAASSCGPSYVVHIQARTLYNTCAGNIGAPLRFSIQTGRRFTIVIGHEAFGALDFPIPAPVGSGVREVARHGASVVYVARSVGTTRLLARHTRFCSNRGARVGTCAAAVVRVTAGSK